MSCVVWLYPCTIFLPVFFFFNDTATTEIYTLSLHDALPILGWGATSDEKAMAAYLAMWGLFTAVMFIGTLRLNRALQVVFGTLTILFFMLAIGDFTGASAGFKHLTGYEGIVCGFSAIYAGLAQVLNELFGKTVLPLGPVKK